jgi:uncharacterized membrane protein YgcG
MFRFKDLVPTGLLGLFVLTGILASSLAFADERILNYHSNILVHTDGSIVVTESIRVRAEGHQIRRGIYRDFPTAYKDRHGNHYNVTFVVLEVQRDNAPEPFHTENRSNGVRVYVGSRDTQLSAGEYEYRLRYKTTRQIGFFEQHDELYWNVTGNGWIFPIDKASASIELPQAVFPDDLRTSFYTGYQGASETNATSRPVTDRKTEFRTTVELQAHEGLTIALGWPKGIVQEPTQSEQLGYFLDDNGAALALITGVLLPLGWYLWAWNSKGRDPRKGIIIPLFEPPTGLTPAGCSYVRKMAFNKNAFAAAVVNLGVKGYLEINESPDEFVLHRRDNPGSTKASRGELAVLNALFNDGQDKKIELDQENYKAFLKASRSLNKALKTEHLGRVFNLNSLYALPALGIGIIAAVIAANMNGGPMIWIPFAILTVALHIIFLLLMRAPTPAGRKLMDEIEGFRMYLNTAEQSRLDRMRSPELTPEVFEMFLPYAFALGVENNWCSRFANEFPRDLSENNNYRPGWYSGRHRGLNGIQHLGSSFNKSFSSAISSAATPPGSSSGSGGGGSSGGGGGGGGGGGW